MLPKVNEICTECSIKLLGKDFLLSAKYVPSRVWRIMSNVTKGLMEIHVHVYSPTNGKGDVFNFSTKGIGGK